MSRVGRAGGCIGDARTEINTFENCKIEDCTILSTTEYVGGIIGYLNPNLSGYTTTVTNQQVTGTTIQTLDTHATGSNTIVAGGIIGYVYNIDHTIEIGKIYIGQACNIRGSRAGGGIFGSLYSKANVKINDWIGIGAQYNSDTGVWTEDTGFNNISGRIAGGITGSDESLSERLVALNLCFA